MSSKSRSLSAMAVIAVLAVSTAFGASYKIEHSPVTVSIQGQPLSIRARLSGAYGDVQRVTLLYAVSRDAAPFRIPMRASGPGIYSATIAGNLLSGVDQVAYYIEAADSKGATRETPWYTVKLRVPSAVPSPAASSSTSAGEEGWHWGWRETAILAGGGVLVGGGYLLLDHGGGSSGGGGTSSTTNSGTYAGTVTLNTTVGDSGTTYETSPMTVTIDAAGNVSSTTLHAGQTLTGRLEGRDFALVATVEDGTRNGEIQYVGTVLEGQMAGSIQGSATSSEGNISYSGSFSATRE